MSQTKKLVPLRPDFPQHAAFFQSFTCKPLDLDANKSTAVTIIQQTHTHWHKYHTEHTPRCNCEHCEKDSSLSAMYADSPWITSLHHCLVLTMPCALSPNLWTPKLWAWEQTIFFTRYSEKNPIKSHNINHQAAYNVRRQGFALPLEGKQSQAILQELQLPQVKIVSV